MIDRRTIFEIYRLFNEGLSERRIAKGLLISRKSVAKYLEEKFGADPSGLLKTFIDFNMFRLGLEVQCDICQ